MAIIATGSRHDLAYIAEVTYGTTPGTPTLQKLRHTGTTLGLSKDSIESEELREDRHIAHYRHGNKSVGGDVNFEMSYGTYDDFLEAVMCGTWTTSVLKAGATSRSFTIGRYHADVAEYIRSTGCSVNTFSLSVAPNSMVTGSFGILGQNTTITASALASSTYTAESTTAPFDSFTGAINIDDQSSAIVTALELNVTNGMEPQYVVGSSTIIQPALAKSMVTGSVTYFLLNSAEIDKFAAETPVSLDFKLQDAAGKNYIFDMPNCKYTTGNPEVTAPGAVTVTMDFIALYDSASGSNLTITRDPNS